MLSIGQYWRAAIVLFFNDGVDTTHQRSSMSMLLATGFHCPFAFRPFRFLSHGGTEDAETTLKLARCVCPHLRDSEAL